MAVAGSIAPMGPSAQAVTIVVDEPDLVASTAYLFDTLPGVEGR